MDVKVFPGRLSGTISAPPSKSIAHRAILCSMLSGGPCSISNLQLTEDIQATLHGTKAMFTDNLTVDCRESASTLRFLLLILAALGRRVTFTGGARLSKRPLEPLLELLKDHGVQVRSEGNSGWFPLSIEGKLRGNTFSVPGDVSSQFICGLLMAMPLTGQDCEIILTTPLVSRDYITLTIDVMNHFGVKVKQTASGWFVPRFQSYVAKDFEIEGDYSGAAYFLCANQLPRGNVTVTGLSPDSKQADKALLNILPALGNGLEVDVKDIPDSVPLLAVMAAFAPGRTTLRNAGRLQVKECDRLTALKDGIIKMGGHAEVDRDSLLVYGGRKMAGGVTVSSIGDHRIAMAFSIGALGCEDPVTITKAASVIQYYPDFYKDFQTLGGSIELLRHAKG